MSSVRQISQWREAGVQSLVHQHGNEIVLEDRMHSQAVANVLARVKLFSEAKKNPRMRTAASVPTTEVINWRKEWQSKWSDMVSWPSYRDKQIDSYQYKNLRVNYGKQT